MKDIKHANLEWSAQRSVNVQALDPKNTSKMKSRRTTRSK